MPSIRALMRLAAPQPRRPPPADAAEESPPQQQQQQHSGSPRFSSPSSSSASAPARPAAAPLPPGRVYPLRDFPGCEAAALCGAFRDNARWLLARWAPVAASPGPAVRRAFLSDDRTGAVVPVVAVEVLAASSPAPLCDFCRCAGECAPSLAPRVLGLGVVPAPLRGRLTDSCGFRFWS